MRPNFQTVENVSQFCAYVFFGTTFTVCYHHNWFCGSWMYIIAQYINQYKNILKQWFRFVVLFTDSQTHHKYMDSGLVLPVLTYWGRDKMDAISQTKFWSAFSWMEMFEFRLKFHWSLFPRVQLTILQHWFRQWLGAVQATSDYLNQWWLDYRRIYASLGFKELNVMSPWGVSTGTATRFTNVFLLDIQIRLKSCFAVNPLQVIRSQRMCAHATTAELSCHVKKCSYHLLESSWEWNEISI